MFHCGNAMEELCMFHCGDAMEELCMFHCRDAMEELLVENKISMGWNNLINLYWNFIICVLTICH